MTPQGDDEDGSERAGSEKRKATKGDDGRQKGLRPLTEDEMKMVAGGADTDPGQFPPPGPPITVTANPNPPSPTGPPITVTANPNPPSPTGPPITVTANPSPPGNGPPITVTANPPPKTPPCDEADQAVSLSPPDNAPYYVPKGTVPKGVTAEYLSAVVNHFTDIATGRDNPAGLVGAHERVLNEFYNVYTDENSPFFVDFKTWGNTSGGNLGPPGSTGAGDIEYYSDAAGKEITAPAFEPFGNFFYGFLGTLAGISPEELDAAAAYLQQGGVSGFHDAPEDQPHVAYGIQVAHMYLADNQTYPAFGISEIPCP